MEEKDKLRQGVRAARILTLASLTLTILKAIVGFASNSLVLITDALHSGSDLVMSLASFIGLKISQRKPNEKFPYGYYKAENIATFIIALLIIYGGVEAILKGVGSLTGTSEIRMPLLAMATALFASVVSYFVANHTKKIGEEIKSQSLIANGKERLLDVLSALMVFLAILLSYYHIKYVEGITTIIIAVFVIKVGIEAIKDSTLSLMDYNPEVSMEVKKFLDKEGDKYKIRFNKLKLRRAGPFLMGEVNAEIPEKIELKRAYEILKIIDDKVSEKFDINSFRSFLKPREKNIVNVIVPLNDSELSEHFGRANKFLFLRIDLKKKNILIKKEIKNPYVKKSIRAGLSTVKYLEEKTNRKIDFLITKQIGEISFHLLKDNLIEILKAEGKDLDEVIKRFMNRQLKPLEKETREKD